MKYRITKYNTIFYKKGDEDILAAIVVTYPTLLISAEGENVEVKPSFLYEFDNTEEEGIVAHL